MDSLLESDLESSELSIKDRDIGFNFIHSSSNGFINLSKKKKGVY